MLIKPKLKCAWKPLSISELSSLFVNLETQFWIAGGWAIDLFLNKETRSHEDLDVVIRREEQCLFQKALAGWDLQACDPPGSGTLRPWQQGEILPKNVHNVWCRMSSELPWCIELLLCEFKEDRWIYRRNKSIGGVASDFGWKHDDGFYVLAPEIQLLYKSKQPREKDLFDFQNCLQFLSYSQKSWLKQSIVIESGPNHPWLKDLE